MTTKVLILIAVMTSTAAYAQLREFVNYVFNSKDEAKNVLPNITQVTGQRYFSFKWQDVFEIK
jgi:hypothetical protein